MRVTGVRLDDGSSVWVDARDLTVTVLDELRIRVGGEAARGWVFVSPDQVLQAPNEVVGVVTEVCPRASIDASCPELPGAEMPPLGTSVELERARGTVTGIDAVRQLVTITRQDGLEVTASLAEIVVEAGSG